MATRFVNIDRDTVLLLPPGMREWMPVDHLVHFILDAVEASDVSQLQVNTRGTGDEQYPPSMQLALLAYSYATGVFARRIEQSTYENVAVRVLTADTHPGPDACGFVPLVKPGGVTRSVSPGSRSLPGARRAQPRSRQAQWHA